MLLKRRKEEINMSHHEKNKIGILGCGWIGTALGNHLSSNGYSVWGTTTQSSRFGELREAGIEPVLLKIGNPPDQKGVVLPGADLLLLMMSPSVVWNGRHVLSRLIRSTGAKCLLLASSTSVYPSVNKWVREDDAEYIKSPHSGIVLLSLEDHFRNIEALNTVVFRFAGLYGPGREPGRFISNRHVVAGPDSPVNMVHLEDCVRAIMIVIENQPLTGIYNICADKHPKREEFYTAAARKIGLEAPRFSEESVDYKLVDNTLFRNRFQFDYLHPDPLADLDAE